MREDDWESGEEAIDESGRNPTQQRLDDEETRSADAPADTEWETTGSPREGEDRHDTV